MSKAVFSARSNRGLKQILTMAALGGAVFATANTSFADPGLPTGPAPMVGATTPVQAEDTLATTMKQIGGLVKQIATASADKTQNPQSVLAARKLQDLFKHAQDFTPDSIAQMAPGDQPAAKADFVKRLNSEIQHAVALEVAFKNDDNAGAATILAQMNAEKKEGHGIYDP